MVPMDAKQWAKNASCKICPYLILPVIFIAQKNAGPLDRGVPGLFQPRLPLSPALFMAPHRLTCIRPVSHETVSRGRICREGESLYGIKSPLVKNLHSGVESL